jgi:predicted ATP-dependent serine protease
MAQKMRMNHEATKSTKRHLVDRILGSGLGILPEQIFLENCSGNPGAGKHF